jgi:hypothetical protein
VAIRIQVGNSRADLWNQVWQVVLNNLDTNDGLFHIDNRRSSNTESDELRPRELGGTVIADDLCDYNNDVFVGVFGYVILNEKER